MEKEFIFKPSELQYDNDIKKKLFNINLITYDVYGNISNIVPMCSISYDAVKKMYNDIND